jgi:hypothetical protein
MRLSVRYSLGVVALLLAFQNLASAAETAPTIRPLSPTRPLPVASMRPKDAGPARFVDAKRGDDQNDGSEQRPWKTLQHGVRQLRPGDTLYLRAGNYDEHVVVEASGTREQPITVRSFPGELVFINGGLPEFRDNPAEAWEPCPEGAEGEFWSTKTYPDLGGRAQETNLLGNFADSMIALQGYHFHGDLRSNNPYWNIDNKSDKEQNVYCGPGVYYDPTTGRIHARLAHTQLAALGDDNYRGETDPRRVPMIVAGHKGGSALELRGAQNIRLQDLVLRGAREATLALVDCRNVELDGLTIYGGSTAVLTRGVVGLRMVDTALRGISAPWTFRGSLKYRSIESRILSAAGWDPSGAEQGDFEFAFCEFTDSVDGVFLGNVRRVRFHHNLLDNVSDDGIFLTAATGYDGVTPGGDVELYQNLFSRCLTTFAFGVGHGRQKTIAGGKQMGAGVRIMRNVFDFRQPVHYHWPTGPDDPLGISSLGRFSGDHGSPAWEPMWIYHNTMLAGDPPRYDYLTDGWGKAMGHGTQRRVFNNIVCQLHGMPGATPPPANVDFQGDGNLLWSVSDGPAFRGDLFAKFRASAAYNDSKVRYPAGWTTHDRFADPQFVSFNGDWHSAVDLRLQEGSPAVNAGVEIRDAGPDPLRSVDAGAPDIGALPLGAEPWRVGVRGRYTAFGELEPTTGRTISVAWTIPSTPEPSQKRMPRAIVVEGYPAFDAPLVEFALRRNGFQVDGLQRTWFDTRKLSDYSLVAIDGNFARAGIDPKVFAPEDLIRLREYLAVGGTLLLMRERTDLFATPEGQQFLTEITGRGTTERAPIYSLREPTHPWLKHLAAEPAPAWFQGKLASPIRASRGESLIGSPNGSTVLYRVPVGKGQLIYIGWTISSSMPNGRKPSTIEQERAFEEQMQILLNVVGDANAVIASTDGK